MRKVPKNCLHCFFYYKEEHWCLEHNIPISNVNVCMKWRPAIMWLTRYDLCKFVDYNHYFMNSDRIYFIKNMNFKRDFIEEKK